MQQIVLPAEICEKHLLLQKELNLMSGAINMRLTEVGEFVFLEVNPAGRWLFIEERTGLPISQSIANLLIHLASKVLEQIGIGHNQRIAFDLEMEEVSPGTSLSHRVHIDIQGNGILEKGDLLTTRSFPVPLTGNASHMEITLQLI